MSSTDPTAPASPPSRRAVGWRIASLLVGIAVVGLVVALLATQSNVPPVEPQSAGDPVPLGLTSIPEDSAAETAQRAIGYVGMDACVNCHADRCAEFRGTRHAQACVVPDPDNMPAAFTAGGVYQSPQAPVRFEMGRKDREFFVSAIRDTPQGEQRTQSPIAFVYGSGAGTDEVFFTWHGDRLYELPIVWLHPLNSWGADPFDPQGSGDFSREWTIRCVECHNTWLEYVPGSLNEYKRDHLLLGVTCEKCHGPGRLHVEHHAANPDDKLAHAITVPRDLPRERQMDLCALCHSNSLYHRRPPFSYKPGDRLDDYYRTLSGTQHPEEDHVANQTAYLKQSRCYAESESLTCTTCHNPHRPRSPEHMGSGESACMRCHQPADCREQPRLPTAVQNNCVGCHMPVGNKIQVYFQTESDAYVAPVKRWEHRIAVHPRARDTVLLAWLRTQTDADSAQQAAELTGKLADDWTKTAESCHGDYRTLAEIDAWRHVVDLRPTDATRERLAAAIDAQARIDRDFAAATRLSAQKQYPEAIRLLQGILELNPRLAKAHARLGVIYAGIGERKRAVDHLERVAEYDPDSPGGYAMLGWLDYLDGRAESAIQYFQKAYDVEPSNAKIHYQMALAQMKLEHWDQAVEWLHSLLRLDPRHAGGCQAMAHVLRQLHRAEEALPYAQRAAQLTQSQNSDILLTLAEVYHDLKREADAAHTADLALTAASRSSQSLSPTVRGRLEELRAESSK